MKARVPPGKHENVEHFHVSLLIIPFNPMLALVEGREVEHLPPKTLD